MLNAEIRSREAATSNLPENRGDRRALQADEQKTLLTGFTNQSAPIPKTLTWLN